MGKRWSYSKTSVRERRGPCGQGSSPGPEGPWRPLCTRAARRGRGFLVKSTNPFSEGGVQDSERVKMLPWLDSWKDLVQPFPGSQATSRLFCKPDHNAWVTGHSVNTCYCHSLSRSVVTAVALRVGVLTLSPFRLPTGFLLSPLRSGFSEKIPYTGGWTTTEIYFPQSRDRALAASVSGEACPCS